MSKLKNPSCTLIVLGVRSFEALFCKDADVTDRRAFYKWGMRFDLLRHDVLKDQLYRSAEFTSKVNFHDR